MRQGYLVPVFVPVFLALTVSACLGPRPTFKGDGGGDNGEGGDTGSGGAHASGGSSGSGGKTGAGGATGYGGGPGMGTGGATGTGGAAGMGGATPTGGRTGTGGIIGTGGIGMGGMIGVGGKIGTGGSGTGGSGTGGSGTGGAGTGGSGIGGMIVITGPCDVLAAAGNPCVAAHSTVRVLLGSYTGPLYQVCRGTSVAGPSSCAAGTAMDIGAITSGYANAAAQDTFCAGMACTISTIYDQSGKGNHLKPAPGGNAKATADNPATATDVLATINGHAAYGVFLKANVGYRAGCTGCGVATATGTATGDAPETIYMVTSEISLADNCCFDYGNAETTKNDDGNGAAEAVYFGGGVVWGTGSPGGHTNGPWVMADLENGLYAGWENNQDQNISTNTPLRLTFVTAVLVGDTMDKNAGMGRFALYGGDATTGTLKTMYDGIRPAKTGYVPMHKEGSIVLGIAGDNSDGGAGWFFEGVMASGAATLTTINALQANIVAAGYGK